MSEKLKPCPFCGGEAVIQRFTSVSLPFRIICSCGAEIRGGKGEQIADAVERWNRRAERTCRVVAMDAAGSPPYRTGDWIYNELSDGCSECGYPFDTLNRGVPVYCAHCGAKVVE